MKVIYKTRTSNQFKTATLVAVYCSPKFTYRVLQKEDESKEEFYAKAVIAEYTPELELRLSKETPESQYEIIKTFYNNDKDFESVPMYLEQPTVDLPNN